MAAVGAAALGAGIAATNSAVMNYLNDQASSKANSLNYEQNVKLWRMNNAYNTPAMQMQRLEEAGLNPNLVYGSGSVAGNTSSQPSAPAVHPSRFELNLTNAFMGKNFQLMDEQLKGIREQNKIVAERYRALRFNNDFYINKGIPTNSPFYYGALQSYASDPAVVNFLKGLGYKAGELFYKMDHLGEREPEFDQTPASWTWNGKVNITHGR